MKSPAATTDALLEANPDLDPKLTRAEVDATLPLLGGEQDEPRRVGRFIAWMKENDLIASEPPASEVLSNAYVPGKIPE